MRLRPHSLFIQIITTNLELCDKRFGLSQTFIIKQNNEKKSLEIESLNFNHLIANFNIFPKSLFQSIYVCQVYHLSHNTNT